MTQYGTHIETLLSSDRVANLIKYSQKCANLGGYLFEAGIFSGGSLEIMAKYNPGINILAVDSFEGVPLETEYDYHRLGDFGGLDFHSIAGFFKMVYPTVRIVKGFIPNVFDYFDDHTKLSFSHIDLDMYDSVRLACDFVFPRTLSGGMILFDDFATRSTPGATKAILEFFEDKECKFKGELFYHEGGDSHKQYLVAL